MIRPLVALVVGLFLVSPALAAKPTEELLRLVPQDAALCLIVQDIRGHTRQLAESPFLDQLRKSPLAKLLPEEAAGQQLAEVDKVLQTYLQTSVAEIRDEIVGDALVCAFWPGGPNIGERALILTKARKPDLASSLLQRIQQVQLQSGDLQRVEPLQHRGFKYARCTERAGKTNYRLVHEGVIAIAQDEPTLQHVIQVLADNPPGNAIARQLQEMGVLDAFGIFWINPRAFDAEMAAKAKTAEGNDAAFLKNFQLYWKCTAALAIALRLEKEAELSLNVRMAVGDLPPAARRFLNHARKHSTLWPLIPKDTILAISGRWNPADLFEMLTEFAPEEARQKALGDLNRSCQALFGRDLKKHLLPQLGPDVAIYVAAPPAELKPWFPNLKGWVPDVVLAVRAEKHGLDIDTLTDGLRTVGGLVALSRTNEGKPTVLRTMLANGTKIVYLESERDFPVGFQPAGAEKNGCLVLASSPGAIQRFGWPGTGSTQPTGPLIPLARVSAKNLVESYLKNEQRRQGLAATLAHSHATTAEDVNAKLDALQGILELFDSLELLQNSDGDQTTLTLRLHTARPLKKGG